MMTTFSQRANPPPPRRSGGSAPAPPPPPPPPPPPQQQQQQQQQQPHPPPPLTEAQLRWAQFHRRRRAQALGEKLERWYQTPELPSDVLGALSDDGNSSSSSSSVADGVATNGRTATERSPPLIKKKIAISRGRRALLRVSRRNYETRRAIIAERGYRGVRGANDGSDDSDSDDDDDDALAAIFAEESWLRKRRHKTKRRHRRRLLNGRGACDDDDDDGDLDRVRRFEEAFKSLLVTLSAHNQRHEIITATKIWKRSMEPADLDFTKWQLPPPSTVKKPMTQLHHLNPAAPPIAASYTGLTMESVETKSASTASQGEASDTPQHPFPTRTPADSWKRRDTAEGTPNDGATAANLFPSPYRPSFRELVDLLQQQLGDDDDQNPSSPPRMRLDKFFRRTFDEKKEDEYASAGEEDAYNSDEEAMMESYYLKEMQASSPLLEELEHAQPGLSRQVFQLYLRDNGATPFTARRQLLSAAKRQLEVCALECLSQKPNGDGDGEDRDGAVRSSMVLPSSPVTPGVVRDLVARLEGTIRREPKIWLDGKLHKPEFARLVREYLLEARRQQRRQRFSREATPTNGKGSRRLLYSFPEEEEDKEEEYGVDGCDDDDSQDPFAQVLEEERLDRERCGEWDEREITASPSLVESFIDQMPEEALVDSSGRVTDAFKGMVARYLEEAAKKRTPRKTPEQELLADDGDVPVPANDGSVEESLEDQRLERRQFAQEFVRHLQRSNAVEPVFTPDGKLVSRPSLEKFVARFVQQSAVTPKNANAASAPDFLQSIRSPELLARARQMSSRRPQNRPSTGRPHALRSPGNTRAFVEILQAQLEQRIVENGPLTATSLEGAVEQALQELTKNRKSVAPVNVDEVTVSSPGADEPLFDDLEDFIQPFVAKLELMMGNSSPGRGASRGDAQRMDEVSVGEIVNSCLPPSARITGATFVERFVSEFTDSLAQPLMDPLDHSTLESLARDCAVHATSDVNGVRGSVNPASRMTNDDSRPTDIVGEVMSGRFGGILKWYRHGSNDTEDEMNAVAAFRSNRLHHQGEDDTSSLSSFRVPDGFKKVVETFRRNSHVDESSGDRVTSNPSAGSFEDTVDVPKPLLRDSVNFSADRLKLFHQKVKEKSALIGDGDALQSIIDTDGSEASVSVIEPTTLSNLLLSPTILTKRLQQAIRAVETRSWEQVSYLLTANPWLAEMMDLKTNQYLLHKCALYGASAQDGIPPAPDGLNNDLLRLFPSAVHKFDNDGNLPLHMAAASANLPMIRSLGERFPSGASVRNEDGMLPLHLVVLASASLRRSEDASELVKSVLELFPGAVSIADNDGNLPIHIAASALKDDAGVDTVFALLDEADRQVEEGARFRSKVRMKHSDNASLGTETADSMGDFDEERCCSLVRNEAGDTPLMVAIRSRAGWKVIEALLSGAGGEEAALCVDFDMNNTLHLLVNDRWKDPKSVMSVLRVAPDAARMKNTDGMIPLEIACMQGAPREVLLAMALVDLPFDLDDIEFRSRGLRDGFGASWVFLTCECDDAYLDVVEEVLSLCSYPQSRELCFFDLGSGETLLARATPMCRMVLQRSLRFLGRFEFVSAQSVDTPDYRVFDAIDFGTKDATLPEGNRVILKCYIDRGLFDRETKIVRTFDLDFSLLEEVSIFAVGEDGMPATSDITANQFCLSIEEPSLTLLDVMNGMLASDDCQTVCTIRERYAEKVFAVLRLVAKALRHLHSLGLAHGSVCGLNCGKYGSRWKLRNVLGTTRSEFDSSLEESNSLANPMTDVWEFGMLAFEVLVGERLFGSEEVHRQQFAADWDRDRQIALQRLDEASVTNSGASLILSCLNPNPDSRPTMNDLLRHSFWKELKRPSAPGLASSRIMASC